MKLIPSLHLMLACCLASSAAADPSEKNTAWPDAPLGFHWAELGPRTTAVVLQDYARVLHVSVTTGSNATGSGTRERPMPSVAAALEAAGGDGRTAILVAAGRYESSETLQLRARVDLFGGFDPQSWQRDIFRSPTVLSGGGSHRVLLGADDCRLDGFIVEEGVVRDHGGALFCNRVSPRITNNIFRRNRTIEPEDFSHDQRQRRMRGHDGGAIALHNASNADIRNNLFHDNETGVGYGGALVAREDCMPIIAHNVFWGNRSGVTDRNKTLSGNGGAVSLLFSSRAAVFHNLFAANDAQGGSDAGALFCDYFSWPEIRHNAFLNNHAGDDGGGLDTQKFSFPKLHANLFYGNRADGSGAGLHLDDAVIEMENNVFAYNSAKKQAGGFGGSHGWYRALNNTVVHNAAGQDGGGLHIVNVKNKFLRPPVFRNNLFAFNQPDQVLIEGEVDATYNLMHPGGYAGGYYNRQHRPKFLEDGKTLEVREVRPEPATFTTVIATAGAGEPGSLVGRIVRIGTDWTMVRENDDQSLRVWGLIAAKPAGPKAEIMPTFHHDPESPAINDGVYGDFAPVDIDGEPRYTPTIDIGADEYHPPKKPAQK